MNTELMFSSKTDLWSTPDDFFELVNKEFNFNLDVCAVYDNSKCNYFFSPYDNGLDKDWGKNRCWMNPPYGKTIVKWIKKAYESSINGAIVVGLLPSRTDTRWFHDYIYNKAEIRFIKGRLKFGGNKNPAPFPSMLVIWKNK